VIVRTTRIGRFSLLREIGSGGMGTVFAAYDEQLDRKVALKILRKPRAGSERQRNQILREARAAARVAHPCVVSVYEVSEADGLIHIAMEFVEGETLHAWQSKGAHHWRQILSMYIQVGQALQAAHEVDVVHRDFKPENVLIGEDERPRVVDFGLARVGVDEHSPAADSAADRSPQIFSTGHWLQ
jgi:serine/threonine protein kinase